MLKLHGFSQSGNTFKVAFLLRALGVPWQPVHLPFADFAAGATRDAAWRERVNEMGEVPVLEAREGRKTTQSGVILTMLAEQHGAFGGTNADERRDVLRWLFFDNHKFTSHFATWRFMKSFAAKAPDPAVAAYLRARIDSAFGIVDKHSPGATSSSAMRRRSPTCRSRATSSTRPKRAATCSRSASRTRRLARPPARGARLGRPVRGAAGRARGAALVTAMTAARAVHDHLDWPFFEAAPRRLRARARRVGARRTSRDAHDRMSTPRVAAWCARSATRGWLRMRSAAASTAAPRTRSTRAPSASSRETLARHCRPRRLRVRDAGPRLGRDQPRRHGRAAGALPAARRAGRGDRRVRALRARRRLRRRRDAMRRPRATATTTCSTARRRGSRTAASPTSTSSSRTASRRGAAKRGQASRPSSSTPTRRAFRSPSAST